MNKETQSEKYQGWSNWPTWGAHLWLSNSEFSYNKIKNLIASKEVNTPKDMQILGVHLLTCLGNPDCINFVEVNWAEILEAFKA